MGAEYSVRMPASAAPGDRSAVGFGAIAAKVLRGLWLFPILAAYGLWLIPAYLRQEREKDRVDTD